MSAANKTWRVINTGLRPAAQNVAYSRALLEARRANEIPNTLRFARFTPCALLGFQQSAEQEFDLGYCRDHAIAVQRRITVGAAVYLDKDQLAWELYLSREDLGAAGAHAIARRILHAAAAGVSALGLDARYRAPGDIEVGGRKIAGGTCVFDGDAVSFQGTLFVALDIDRVLRVLRIAAEKMSGTTIDCARDRMADLQRVLGGAPDVAAVKRNIIGALESEFEAEIQEDEVGMSEHVRYQRALKEIDTQDWVDFIRHPASSLSTFAAEHACAQGKLRVSLVYDRSSGSLRQVWFDVDLEPALRRAVAGLEAALAGTPYVDMERKIQAFFSRGKVKMSTLTADDFIAVIRRAVKHPIAVRS